MLFLERGLRYEMITIHKAENVRAKSNFSRFCQMMALLFSAVRCRNKTALQIPETPPLTPSGFLYPSNVRRLSIIARPEPKNDMLGRYRHPVQP
jgi:hypothetical protein